MKKITSVILLLAISVILTSCGLDVPRPEVKEIAENGVKLISYEYDEPIENSCK